uniref:Uncharacterized protein n=1 Tax=Zea mays TaxID=4577 RepID=C4J0X9_MAIZE|nr:unknown [Zea mays]
MCVSIHKFCNTYVFTWCSLDVCRSFTCFSKKGLLCTPPSSSNKLKLCTHLAISRSFSLTATWKVGLCIELEENKQQDEKDQSTRRISQSKTEKKKNQSLALQLCEPAGAHQHPCSVLLRQQ